VLVGKLCVSTYYNTILAAIRSQQPAIIAGMMGLSGAKRDAIATTVRFISTEKGSKAKKVWKAKTHWWPRTSPPHCSRCSRLKIGWV
jgi:hypothetical protein